MKLAVWLAIPIIALPLAACEGVFGGGGNFTLAGCESADGYIRTIAFRLADGSVSPEDWDQFKVQYLPIIEAFCLSDAPPVADEVDLSELSDALLAAKILSGEE